MIIQATAYLLKYKRNFSAILTLSIFTLIASCTPEITTSKINETACDYFDLKSDSKKISLNGQWMFCLDPGNIGLKAKYYTSGTENKAPWQKVFVPWTYNTGENKYYKGKAWYRKQFTLADADLNNKQVVIRFLGAALRSRVWVNGTESGSSKYGWIPFEIDITDALVEGNNIITVMTDNTILDKGIPDSNWDGWWYYGGIYRDVYLDFRPKCNIRDMYVRTVKSGSEWDFTANVKITNSTAQHRFAKLKAQLLDDNFRIVWETVKTIQLEPYSNTACLKGEISNVKQWSPNNPCLYKLVCKLESVNSHMMSIDAAFRQITTEGSKILLNSEPVVIRGINVHEEHPEYGNALPKRLIKDTLDNIQKLDVNFVRTGHYTQHPYFYEICNRKGLLVWTEIPAWKTKIESLRDDKIYKIYGAGQLKAMVENYRKYPSIVIWSIGNEFKSDRIPARDYVKKAYGLVKSLDSERLVTFASDRHRGNDSIKGVSDLCYDITDIISINEYYGWYYGKDSDLGPKLDEIHGLYPTKPIVISEMGAGAAPDGNIEREKHHYRKNYTLEHQVDHLSSHLSQTYELKRKDYVAGAMIWVWADFYDPHRIKSTHPTAWKGVNLKGLKSLYRKEKPSYLAVKEFYKSLEKEQNN